MTSNIYYHLHRGNASAPCTLYVRVRWSGRSLSTSLGYVIDRDGWDQAEQRCRPRSSHGPARIPAQRINNDIDRVTAALTCLMDDPLPDPAKLRRVVAQSLSIGPEAAAEHRDTAQIYDAYIREQTTVRGWSRGTIAAYRVMGAGLLKCGHFADLAQVGEHSLVAYMGWMRDGEMSDNCITPRLNSAKAFLAWCKRKGLVHPGSWEDFSPRVRTSSRPVIYLTWDELMTLWNCTGLTDAQRQALDVFLLQCFTGLRYSDAIDLRWSQVHEDWLEVVTHKTGKRVRIELNKWSIDVLTRYMDEGLPDDRVFYPRGIQQANVQLKCIARLCGIDTPIDIVQYRGGKRVERTAPKYEMVTSHVARRTFVCNALRLGIPQAVVMSWTGHSSYDAMRPYIDIDDDTRAAEMHKLDR